MFVFGGSVAGPKPRVEEEDPDRTAIHRIEEFHKQEGELVQELAKVRSEIRKEIVQRSRKRYGVGKFLDDHFSKYQRSRTGAGAGADPRGGKDRRASPSRPSRSLMLPVINSAGQGMFEPVLANNHSLSRSGSSESLGSQEGNDDSGGSHGSQDNAAVAKSSSMPVFRLPSVFEPPDPSSNKPPQGRRRSVTALDYKEEAIMAAALGLTEEELNVIEGVSPVQQSLPPVAPMQREDQGKPANPRRKESKSPGPRRRRSLYSTAEAATAAYGSAGAGGSRRADALAQTAPTQQTPPSIRRHVSASTEYIGRRRKGRRGKEGRPGPGPGRASSTSREALRKQLAHSLASVDAITSKVKQQMEAAAALIPPTQLKAKAFTRKWGRKKLFALFARITNSKLASAWAAWRHHLYMKAMSEKREAVRRYKCIRTIERMLEAYQQSSVIGAFFRWHNAVEGMKHADAMKVRHAAASRVQRIARGWLARRLLERRKHREEQRRLDTAAERIQRLFRFHSNKSRGRELLRRIKAGLAATEIQRMARGRLARRLARGRRRFLIASMAATHIQRIIRGFLARRRVWWKRNMEVAMVGISHMQRLARGFLARRRVYRIRVRRAQVKVALALQSRYRGYRARARVAKIREERRRAENYLHRNATAIQKIYRGHSTRLRWALKLERHRKLLWQQRAAATQLQALYRGYRVRQDAKDREKRTLEMMMDVARQWEEVFDADAQGMYYINETTGQSDWKPPRSGYRTVAGQLVLSNGKIMDDPKNGEKPKCVECEMRDAEHWCMDCDDPYCDPCYTRMHRKGKKAKHKSVKIQGNGQWMADKYAAALEQQQQQQQEDQSQQQQQQQMMDPNYMAQQGYDASGYGGDPYGMYGGDPSMMGMDPSMMGMDPSMMGMDPSMSQSYYDETGGMGYGDGSDMGWGGAGGGGGEDGGVDIGQGWLEYMDPNSGVPYYYNAMTGETVWERPV